MEQETPFKWRLASWAGRIIYYLLRDGSTYQDLGGDYFDKLDKTRIQQHHVRRIEQLGYRVTLAPAAA